jgi:hypothetical protein
MGFGPSIYVDGVVVRSYSPSELSNGDIELAVALQVEGAELMHALVAVGEGGKVVAVGGLFAGKRSIIRCSTIAGQKGRQAGGAIVEILQRDARCGGLPPPEVLVISG